MSTTTLTQRRWVRWGLIFGFWTGLGLFFAVILALAITLSFMLTAPINRAAHRVYAHLEASLLPFETTERHPDEQRSPHGVPPSMSAEAGS